tara:strand:- start:2677 stop:3432 length:756 start_codon:yes stop_codon:yes gene_type:complete
MRVGLKLKFVIVSAVVLLRAVAANADVDIEGSVADAGRKASAGDHSNPVGDPATCVDPIADCSTLMVNYYNDSVEFALFQRGNREISVPLEKRTEGGAASAQARPLENLSKRKEQPLDSNQWLLGIDFLRGFEYAVDNPEMQDEFAGAERGAVEVDAMHDWAVAAATSIAYRHRHSRQSDPAVSSHLRTTSATTFWDFEYVYQWEVGVNVFDSEACDPSQVALSNIYIPTQVNSTNDHQMVVCALNDADDC